MYDSEEYTLASYQALVEGIVVRALESCDSDDVIVVACVIDEALDKEGISMSFAWVWSRAVIALAEW